jgi:nucleoporin SEH1
MMMATAAAQASTDPPQDDVDEDSTVDRADARLLDHRMRRSRNMIPAGNNNGSPFVLQTNHLDYIHDLVFDTYGRRMASCSGDRFVKIWDMRGVVAAGGASTTAAAGGASTAPDAQQQAQQQSQQQSQAVVRDAWVCSAAWQAHRGSVTCLSWCHPEYGTLLATSGLDQEVKIWEERSTAGLLAGGTNNGAGVSSTAAAVGANSNSNNGSSSSTSSLWTLRASLTEAKRAVTCVAFAPRHCGLKLASASCDGSVRIYEAIDVVNVGSWPLAATLQAYGSNEKDEDDDEDDGGGNRHRGNRYGGTTTADPRASSSSASSYSPSSHWLTLSWCTGRFDPPTLVVGGGTHPTESAISMAASATTATTTSTSSSTAAAGGGGTVNAILIYRYMDTARAWLPMRILPRSVAPPLTSNGAVLASSPALCVAWAPNVGRRYHYVAAAFGDGLVVYKLKRGGIGMGGTAGAAAATSGASSTAAHTTADLEFESAQVLPVASAWRCQWNVTGTVLACSGDSGSVHMYKVSPHNGKFDLVSEIRHNSSKNIADGSGNGQD